MIRVNIEQYNNTLDDLFFWIVQYLISKIKRIKVERNAPADIRENAEKLLLEAKDIQSLKEATLTIRNTGIYSLGNFSTQLIRFYEYVVKEGSLDSLKSMNYDYLKGYINSSQAGLKKATTKNSHLVQIRSLFKYIENSGFDQEENMEYFFYLSVDKRGKRRPNPVKKEDTQYKKFLSENQIDILIEKIDTYPAKRKDKFVIPCMMKFLIFGALGAEEVVNIELSDISKTKLEKVWFLKIDIKSKGNRSREVYIEYQRIKKEYEGYLSEREKEDIGTPYFLYTRNHKKYSARSIYAAVIRLYQHALIYKEGMSVDLLKRSFPLYLLAKGEDMVKIQKYFGLNHKETAELLFIKHKPINGT